MNPLNSPTFIIAVLLFNAYIVIDEILTRKNIIVILAGFALIAIYNMIFIDYMERKADEIKNKKSNKRIQKSSKINKKA
jgi:4-hydroxybenzoate polyprenyltransferase